jgi:hypothetical protein
VRVTIAVFCVLVIAAAGCSSRSPGSTPRTPASTSAVQDESIPGIGATRAAWDDSHTPNPADNDGSLYGDDPSLPSYLTPNGAVYNHVDDRGTAIIQSYNLIMHPLEGDEVLRRVRQELPSDATVAWDLMFDQCYRVAFNSAALEAARYHMAIVQLLYIQPDGTIATNPDRFNMASFLFYETGSRPNPEIDCRGQRRLATKP